MAYSQAMCPAPTQASDNPRLADSSLLQHAIAFAAAADAYAEKTRFPDWFVLHFLIGRAIELTLKAHAITSGASDDFLRHQLGHSLERGLNHAEASGLAAGLDQHERAAVALTDNWYRQKLLEYPEISGYLIPNVRVLRTALDRLLQAVYVSLWGLQRFELDHDSKRVAGLRLADADSYGPDPRVSSSTED